MYEIVRESLLLRNNLLPRNILNVYIVKTLCDAVIQLALYAS